MIKTSTLFILGAGSSAPYGFPVASRLTEMLTHELLEEIPHLKDEDTKEWLDGNSAMDPKVYKEHLKTGRAMQELGIYPAQIKAFAEAFLKSRSSNIDNFLFTQEKFRGTGSAALAAALVPFESEKALISPSYPQDVWDKELFAQMGLGGTTSKWEAFSDNKVGFISFNYDRLLPYTFAESMNSSFAIAKEDALHWFYDRFIHVYGCLGHLLQKIPGIPWRPFEKRSGTYVISNARQAVKFWHEKVEQNIPAPLAQVICNAKQLVFLGFGFDPHNMTAISKIFEQAGRVTNSPFKPVSLNDILIVATNRGLRATNKNEAEAFFSTFFKTGNLHYHPGCVELFYNHDFTKREN